MSNAREEILSRIRRVQSDPASGEYSAIPRQYVQAGSLGQAAKIALFQDRLRDYDARVFRATQDQIREVVAEALNARSKRSLLTPRGIPYEWLPEAMSFEYDNDMTYAALDASEGVLTGCAIAIAATGTIVLRHSRQEGRRALTLIPDYHLCVVYEHQIVETVAEGVRAMARFGAAPMTTVSGPSATSDIEMTRIKGVHGPRTLDVIIARS